MTIDAIAAAPIAGAASSTDLAELIGTIGEEIAVRVSPLVPRIYAGA